MPRELEKSHNPDNGKKLKDVGILHMCCVFLENEVDIEGERGDIVDDVDGGPDEGALAR